MAHGHIWLRWAHTAVLSTPCGFMSPPLLENCTAYWQLALMKQQEFPEGNSLLTSIITISSCGASGSMKVTHPPVRVCSRTAKAAPHSPSSTLSQATMMKTRHWHWEAKWEHLLQMFMFLQPSCMSCRAGANRPFASFRSMQSLSLASSHNACLYLEMSGCPLSGIKESLLVFIFTKSKQTSFANA